MLARAVELDGSTLEYAYFLGLAHIKLGEREQAVKALSQALALDPDPGVARDIQQRLQKIRASR